MALYPQSFIDDLRLHVDIVQVIQDDVPLKRAGASYKGLCPFHSEKTPSFHVNREKGFFHCFGCGVGGDVIKFLELHEKLGFQDAVRHLAQRFGLQVPESSEARPDPAASAEREALLKIHEVAAAYFRKQLESPTGTAARQQLRDRGLTAETINALGLGFAPPAHEGVKSLLLRQGFSLPLIVRSGLVVEREGGQTVDRFRNRLMIPICRESGTVVAFGGRAMEVGQAPKYLNSPETPIYSKGRTLYGLHLTRSAVRKLGYAVLVEGYFDFAQVLQAGVDPVVATCGTALTPSQAYLLRRFTNKVTLCFDPDAAGQSAAVRSCELLVAEGFEVCVAVLPTGADPDAFVRTEGPAAYQALIRTARPYLEYLIDRTAEGYDFGRDDHRREFLARMLAVAARIPDAATRDQFGDRLAHRARVTEEVVRAEIRKAAVAKRTTLTTRELPGYGELKPAEKGLIWAIVHDTAEAMAALDDLEDDDFEGLTSGLILKLARSLRGRPAGALPSALLERLNEGDGRVVTGVAAQAMAPAPAAECARALRRLRYERERAAVQREIDRLQELGADRHTDEIDALWQRKKDLLHRIEGLNA